MTAIWDRLGREANRLSWSDTPWDERRAQKVVDCMRAVYMSIKDRPEYKDLTFYLRSDLSTMDTRPKVLDSLKSALDLPLSRKQMSDLCDVTQALHDFDHRDLPTEFGKTWGHHTEVVIQRKRANRGYAKALEHLHDDYWWEGKTLFGDDA